MLVARNTESKREFWDLVEDVSEGLSNACGCYIFSIRGRAWYVGIAEKQSFKNECFAAHKINQYNEALQKVQGVPELIFLAKITPTGYFANPSRQGHKDIQIVENMLIGFALARNSELQNIRGTKFLREMIIPGILNYGRGVGKNKSVQALKKALGIRRLVSL